MAIWVERTITTPTLHAAAPANDVALVLDATLESGENIRLAMCPIDDEGEEFGCKNIRLKAGANKTVWRIPEDVGGHCGATGDGKVGGDVRVTRVLALRWPSTTPARVRFGGLEVGERELPIESIRVAFDPGTARSCLVKQCRPSATG